MKVALELYLMDMMGWIIAFLYACWALLVM